jgi:Tfp pilus assembly protein PilF
MALGETLRKQNDLAGARRSYDRALELDPTLDIARYNRAVMAKLDGRNADARADLELLLSGAAARDPRFAGAHLDLARMLLKAGEKERAAESFARYQQLGGKEKL